MTEEKLNKIYRIIKIIIYTIPAMVVLTGLYLILFPIDVYKYYPNQPEKSKFKIEKNNGANEISFGIFPSREHRFVDLEIRLDKSTAKNCLEKNLDIHLEKTYRAFLYPEGESIDSKKKLKKIIFDGNNTKYPNGSLLHLKTTNEVFLISRGKKILFPGPEIFEAFGYSWENLISVDKSVIDQFPNHEKKNLIWSHHHPDGTIFQAFPSHELYIIVDNVKRRIVSKELLDKVWPKNYSIAVSDPNPKDRLACNIASKDLSSKKITCRFDSKLLMSSLGGYYLFSSKIPSDCNIKDIYFKNAKITLVTEKSIATAKSSLKNIITSIVNRYVYK